MELSPVALAMSVPSVGTQIDPRFYVGFSLLLARPQGEGHLQESYVCWELAPLSP